jgi:hypothetical protein
MANKSQGFVVFLMVLEFELRAFTLIHSTSPIFVMDFFEIGSLQRFAQAGFKPQSSYLCLLSSQDYRQ